MKSLSSHKLHITNFAADVAAGAVIWEQGKRGGFYLLVYPTFSTSHGSTSFSGNWLAFFCVTARGDWQEHAFVHDDAVTRIAIEGKFGQGKRRFGLGRLMAKLALTSEVMIQISFLVMNVEHLLSRGTFVWLFSWWRGWLFSGKAMVVGPGEHNVCGFSGQECVRDRNQSGENCPVGGVKMSGCGGTTFSASPI